MEPDPRLEPPIAKRPSRWSWQANKARMRHASGRWMLANSVAWLYVSATDQGPGWLQLVFAVINLLLVLWAAAAEREREERWRTSPGAESAGEPRRIDHP